MFKTIAIIIAVALLAVLGYATTRPNEFAVARSIEVNAPAETIYPLIDDFHQWSAWSPYERMEPSMKRTFSGADSGRGAVYAWEGHAKAGTGRMEITRTSRPTALTIALEFTKPFRASDIVEFTLVPSGDVTTVTWSMHGRNGYVAKLMSVFLDMDAMVGGPFETGLVALKLAAEH